MQIRNLLILVIGLTLSGLAYAQDEILSDEEAEAKKLVIVEPTNLIETKIEGEYRLKPYRERRGKWGGTASLGYSAFEPVYYEPNFAAVAFEDIYSSAELPLIEVTLTAKRNYGFGSLGFSFSFGGYQNDADDTTIVDSSLLLLPIRIGATVAFENFAPNPWVVPYVHGGIYTIFYREELGGSSYNGHTEVAPYIHGGVAFALDWIDPRAARLAYEDSGIETSSLFAEVRKQMASNDSADPDFESDTTWAGGVRVEF